MAAATGPVSAKDTGTRPMEMNQSKLATRPSSAVGTSRCLAVAQTMVPAVSSALNARHAAMTCHDTVARP